MPVALLSPVLSLPVLALPFGLAPIATAVAATSAFSATNIDDIFMLLLFFSRIQDHQLRPAEVVGGQFLGVGALVLFSLGAFFGQQLLPSTWLGLLGLLPISLGVSQLLERIEGGDAASCFGMHDLATPPHSGWGLAGVVGVAAVTIANGSDNIGVYAPLFARATPQELAITLGVFGLMTALWCQLAWWLTRTPAIADILRRYSGALMPWVLVVLGVVILIDSHTLADRVLALVAVGCLALMTLSLLRQLQEIGARSPQPPSFVHEE